MRRRLIVIGGGRSEYRGYILQRVSRRYDLVLLSPQDPTWEQPYITDYLKIVPGEDQAIITAAAELHRRSPVDGVVTYHEACVELVARIGTELGVPNCDPAAAGRCRDKFAARQALLAAGVPSARFALVHTLSEARKAAADIGYPVVVKPRGLTAGFGVSKVSDPGELEEACDRAGSNAFPEPWGFRRGILVEEFLDGPEFSVDSACWRGQVRPVIFASKVLGHPPFFEEVGHVVGPAGRIVPDPDAVASLVATAHAALGIENTVTHTEVRLTSAGPRIVEVNGRLGGDVIPLVAEVASGLNLPLASADIAAGVEPDLSVAGENVAGIRFFYTRSRGRVVSVGLAGDFPKPDWLRELTLLVEPGDELDPIPARLHFARVGYAIVVADSPEQCAERMTEVDRHHQLQLEPPERGGSR